MINYPKVDPEEEAAASEEDLKAWRRLHTIIDILNDTEREFGPGALAAIVGSLPLVILEAKDVDYGVKDAIATILLKEIPLRKARGYSEL